MKYETERIKMCELLMDGVIKREDGTEWGNGIGMMMIRNPLWAFELNLTPFLNYFKVINLI